MHLSPIIQIIATILTYTGGIKGDTWGAGRLTWSGSAGLEVEKGVFSFSTNANINDRDVL